MPFGCRGCLQVSLYFQNLCLFVDGVDILCRSDAYLVVVGTPIHGIVVAVDPAVEYDDRNVGLIDAVDDRCKRFGLVWCCDYNVKLVMGEIAQVVDLLFVAVVGRADFDIDVVAQQRFTHDFFVHFGAPVIL